jgi:hypothetical protein
MLLSVLLQVRDGVLVSAVTAPKSGTVACSRCRCAAL